jgi:hypothetical protein
MDAEQNLFPRQKGALGQLDLRVTRVSNGL